MISGKRILSLLLVVECLLAISGCKHTLESKTALFEMPCQPDRYAAKIPYPYECFYISVPQNYLDANGKKVLIPVIRFYSNNPDSRKRPIVDFAGGGPGSAVYLSYANDVAVDYSSFSLDKGHDLILMEVRGVGDAIPSLTCPDIAQNWPLFWQQDIELAQELQLYHDFIEECLAYWQENGIDPKQYHSQNVIRDVEAIRKQLNIESFIAMGNSYAARYAYTYARQYPQNIAKMILLSPALPGQYFESFWTIKGIEVALQAVSQNDEQKVEQLWRAMVQIFERLNQQPLQLNAYFADDFKTGYPVLLNGNRFINTIHSLLYDHMNTAVLLQLLEGKFEDEEWQLAMGQTIGDAIFNIYDPFFSDVVALATFCHEEFPHAPKDVSDEARYRFYLDAEKLIATSDSNLCNGIVDFGQSELFDWIMTETDIPTLLLKGQSDPVIMDSGIEPFLHFFNELNYQELPGMSHFLSDQPCVHDIISDFVESGKVDFSREHCSLESH